MRTAAIIAIALTLCTVASAQRLEIHEDGFRANTDIKGFSQEVGLQWLDANVGITWEAVQSHIGLLIAGIAHYFLGGLYFAGFSGENIIPTIVAEILGQDYVMKATDSLFRLQEF